MFIRGPQVAEIHEAQRYRNRFLGCEARVPASAGAVPVPLIIDVACRPRNFEAHVGVALTLTSLDNGYGGPNSCIAGRQFVALIAGRACEGHDQDAAMEAAVKRLRQQYDFRPIDARWGELAKPSPLRVCALQSAARDGAITTIDILHALRDIELLFGSTHIVVIPEADMRALEPELFATLNP